LDTLHDIDMSVKRMRSDNGKDRRRGLLLHLEITRDKQMRIWLGAS
jgi:hypothetical protein